MPVKVTIDGVEKVLNPTLEWQDINTQPGVSKLEIDKNYYVANFNITE